MTALARGELSRRQAEKEIIAILARVPDAQLPKPDRIEKDREADGIAWYGGRGWHIRPTTCGALIHSRRFDVQDVLEHEWLYRERVRRYGKGFEFRDGKQIGGTP